MATKWNFFSISLKISGTVGQILKWFHRNVPWMILFKDCSRNFDPLINMAVVHGGYLHYTDMKKFFEKFSSLKLQFRLRNNFTENVPWVTLFKNCLWNFYPSINMALVNGGCFHYTDMKKFFKIRLLWNHKEKLYMVLLRIHMSDPGPSWSSCLNFRSVRVTLTSSILWHFIPIKRTSLQAQETTNGAESGTKTVTSRLVFILVHQGCLFAGTEMKIWR